MAPAALVLGLGLGILIGSQLNTTGGHSAAWGTGWQWAQQHWSAYLAHTKQLSLSSAAHWCNRVRGPVVWLQPQGPGGQYVAHPAVPSWDWQQGCIARIRSAGGG